jgi:hypothetical protein
VWPLPILPAPPCAVTQSSSISDPSEIPKDDGQDSGVFMGTDLTIERQHPSDSARQFPAFDEYLAAQHALSTVQQSTPAQESRTTPTGSPWGLGVGIRNDPHIRRKWTAPLPDCGYIRVLQQEYCLALDATGTATRSLSEPPSRAAPATSNSEQMCEFAREDLNRTPSVSPSNSVTMELEILYSGMHCLQESCQIKDRNKERNDQRYKEWGYIEQWVRVDKNLVKRSSVHGNCSFFENALNPDNLWPTQDEIRAENGLPKDSPDCDEALARDKGKEKATSSSESSDTISESGTSEEDISHELIKTRLEGRRRNVVGESSAEGFRGVFGRPSPAGPPPAGGPARMLVPIPIAQGNWNPDGRDKKDPGWTPFYTGPAPPPAEFESSPVPRRTIPYCAQKNGTLMLPASELLARPQLPSLVVTLPPDSRNNGQTLPDKNDAESQKPPSKEKGKGRAHSENVRLGVAHSDSKIHSPLTEHGIDPHQETSLTTDEQFAKKLQEIEWNNESGSIVALPSTCTSRDIRMSIPATHTEKRPLLQQIPEQPEGKPKVPLKKLIQKLGKRINVYPKKNGLEGQASGTPSHPQPTKECLKFKSPGMERLPNEDRLALGFDGTGGSSRDTARSPAPSFESLNAPPSVAQLEPRSTVGLSTELANANGSSRSRWKRFTDFLDKTLTYDEQPAVSPASEPGSWVQGDDKCVSEDKRKKPHRPVPRKRNPARLKRIIGRKHEISRRGHELGRKPSCGHPECERPKCQHESGQSDPRWLTQDVRRQYEGRELAAILIGESSNRRPNPYSYDENIEIPCAIALQSLLGEMINGYNSDNKDGPGDKKPDESADGDANPGDGAGDVRGQSEDGSHGEQGGSGECPKSAKTFESHTPDTQDEIEAPVPSMSQTITVNLFYYLMAIPRDLQVSINAQRRSDIDVAGDEEDYEVMRALTQTIGDQIYWVLRVDNIQCLECVKEISKQREKVSQRPQKVEVQANEFHPSPFSSSSASGSKPNPGGVAVAWVPTIISTVNTTQ